MSVALGLAVGCSRASRGQRVSETAPPPPPVASSSTTAQAATPIPATPIPGHPPVSTSGVVAGFDPSTGVLIFEDGRMVKVTEQSKVLKPVETRAVRPGEQVIVRNALPVGVTSAVSAPGSGASRSRSGKRQKMGTVGRVDQQNQVVWLMDGSGVRVWPSTQMQMGTAGKTIVLTDLQPGDELVIVLADEGSMPATRSDATSPAGTSAAPGTSPPGASTPGAPSALPRTTASAPPADATELMVFREVQAP
jgi:hypothetical protein